MRIAGQVIGLSIAALTLGAWPPLGAPAKPDAKAGPCAGPERRQFDFWLGDWQVRTAGGKPAGVNTIERRLGGCVLHESWRGTSGHRGHSYNIYDASRRQWHQTWVDDQGLLLQLDCGLTGGRMILKRRDHRLGGPANQAADHLGAARPGSGETALGVVRGRRAHLDHRVRRYLQPRPPVSPGPAPGRSPS